MAVVSGFKDLLFLHLSDTAITDDGMTSLAKLPRLQRLYLSGSKVTPRARTLLTNPTLVEVMLPSPGTDKK